MSVMYAEDPAVEALDEVGSDVSAKRSSPWGPVFLLCLCLFAGAGGGGAVAYGLIRYSGAAAPVTASDQGGFAEVQANSPSAPTSPAASQAPAFDPTPLHQEIAELRDGLAELERATRLLPGTPAGEALRRRLEALEAAPRPSGPEQSARSVAALGERVAALEGFTAERDRTVASLNRRLRELDASYARLGAVAAGHAAIADTQAMQAELTGLKAEVAANASAALAAGAAARAAFALAAASEVAQRGGPFLEAHQSLAAALPEDPEVAALGRLAVAGAPSREELQTRFVALERDLDRALRQQAAGAGLIGGVQAVLADQVSVRRTDARETPADRLEAVAGAVQNGNFVEAVKLMSTFSGKAATLAQPWLDAARRRLEIEARLAAIRAKLSKG